jgi:TonB-dependent receptor
VDNDPELYSIYLAHPEWFRQNTVNDYQYNMITRRRLTEDISAGYAEATTRFGSLSANLGIRVENTATDAKIIRRRGDDIIARERAEASQEEIDSGKFTSGTIDYVDYLYYDGQLFSRKRSYTNSFLSGGFKYDFAKNFRAQLSASQAILRPSYTNISATITADSTARTIWVPNPLLKPEKTTKYYASLQYYLNPAGIISVSFFRLDIRDKQIGSIQISREQAERQVGYPLSDAVDFGLDDGGDGGEGGGGSSDIITYYSSINAPGAVSVNGATFEYNQQLTFLPGLLKGLSIFGSFTTQDFNGSGSAASQRYADAERAGFADKSASGGIRYSYNRFNVQLRASWQSDRLASVAIPTVGYQYLINDYTYRRERVIVDLSGGFRLTQNLHLAFSIRNLTNTPDIWYSNKTDRMTSYRIYGSIWNISLKGSF